MVFDWTILHKAPFPTSLFKWMIYLVFIQSKSCTWRAIERVKLPDDLSIIFQYWFFLFLLFGFTSFKQSHSVTPNQMIHWHHGFVKMTTEIKYTARLFILHLTLYSRITLEKYTICWYVWTLSCNILWWLHINFYTNYIYSKNKSEVSVTFHTK